MLVREIEQAVSTEMLTMPQKEQGRLSHALMSPPGGITQISVIPRTEDLQGVQPADVLLPVVMETATGLLGPGASGEGGPTTWVDTRDDRRSGCSNPGPRRARALRVPPDRSCLSVPLHDQEPPSPLAPCPGVPGRSRISPPLGMGRPHSPYSAAESPGSVVGASCLPNQ